MNEHSQRRNAPWLSASATLLLGSMLACADSPPSGPRSSLASIASAELSMIQLAYVCGNTFKVRNPTQHSVTLGYSNLTAHGELEVGEIYVPPRPTEETHADTVFTTFSIGTVTLLHGRQAIGTATNEGITCPPANSSIPPDTIAAGLFRDTLRVAGTGDFDGLFVRGTISVLFEPGTPQAARSAALARVQALTVGGIRAFDTDGYYLVQVPNHAVDAVFAAADTLAMMPGVERAVPLQLYESTSSHRLPNDSAFTNWRLLPRTTYTYKNSWALEAIAAPLAWGCSIGDPQTRVAIVDEGMWPHEDISLAYSSAGEGQASSHALAVAGIIGAHGNNTSGSTGVMWNAALEFHDVRTMPGRPGEPIDVEVWMDATGKALIETRTAHVYEAARRGASVINLSQNPQHTSDPIGSVAAERYRDNFSSSLLSAYRRIPAVQRPLLVVSAGNYNGADASWGGMAAVKAAFPNHVLVVGGMGLNGQREAVSASGRLIDIYAPGESVFTLTFSSSTPTRLNLTGTRSGTSFAAPLVAGTAGLLQSFDHHLTPADIRRLILEGSGRDMRRIDGKPVLNAYEALKAAAEEPGAPLCGNRVWATDGGVFAQRGDQFIERLGSVPQSTFRVDVAHGGSRLLYFDPSTWYDEQFAGALSYADRTWQPSSPTPDEVVTSGTARSTLGYSHGADTLLRAYAGSHAGILDDTDLFSVQHWLEDSSQQITLTYQRQVTGSARPYYCMYYHMDGITCAGAPFRTNGPTGIAGVVGAFAPQGDRYLVAANHYSSVTTYTLVPEVLQWGQERFYNRPSTTYTATRSELWEYTLPDHSGRLLATLHGQWVYSLGISEDGGQIVAMLGAEQSSDTGRDVTSCSVQYRDSGFSETLLSVQTASACAQIESWQNSTQRRAGHGTVAPRRASPGVLPLVKRGLAP